MPFLDIHLRSNGSYHCRYSKFQMNFSRKFLSFSMLLAISHVSSASGYLGFAMDWLAELPAIISCGFLFLMVASLYLGLCLNINGIMRDIKSRMTHSTLGSHPSPRQQQNFWSIVVNEIGLHIELIK